MSEPAHSDRPIGLEDAYGLATPDDSRDLYRRWAGTYDEQFIAAEGYVYHSNLVALHVERARSGPVLDVGCGTGVVGVALSEANVSPVDGVDISPEMLERAAGKGVYRTLHTADVTQPLGFEDDQYAGVVSVGAFTHGHLGPEPIGELVRVTRSGGTITLGINAAHWAEAGFDEFMNGLVASASIDTPAFHSVRIYTNGSGEHADDHARVMQFSVR